MLGVRRLSAPRTPIDWVFLLFAGMVTILGFVLLFRLSRHNPYLFFVCTGLLLHAVAAVADIKYFPGSFTRRVRSCWFALAVGVTVVIFSVTPFPITTVAVGVREIPASLEFILLPAGDDDASRARSAYARRGDKDTVVEFVLPSAVRTTKQPLLMYFGRDSRTYDIFSLTYGTDFLFWRIPVSVYKGADLLEVVSVDDQNAVALVEHDLRLSSRVRSRPRLRISFDDTVIAGNETAWIRPMVVTLWASTFLIASAATIWRGWAGTIPTRVFGIFTKARSFQFRAP